jgi:NADH-quinone oxidoreductase subunit C
MQPQELFDTLVKDLGADAVFDLHADPKKDRDPWFSVLPERIEAVCRKCKDDPRLACDFLECVTGVDYPAAQQITVVYHLYSHKEKHRVVMKAVLARESPRIATVRGVWPVADWQERECFDLLGVVFEGHPDLRRILLPEDWEGHPLRKDYVEKADYHGIPTTRVNPLELVKLGKQAASS